MRVTADGRSGWPGHRSALCACPIRMPHPENLCLFGPSASLECGGSPPLLQLNAHRQTEILLRGGWRSLDALRQPRVAYPLRLLQRVGSAFSLFVSSCFQLRRVHHQRSLSRGWCNLNALRQLRVAYPLRLLQRVGPLFSSSVIPTGATAPSAVAEWRDRGNVLPRRDDEWVGGASAPFASAVFWRARLLPRVGPLCHFAFSSALIWWRRVEVETTMLV
jgi:hypothetical protein